jgi:hypothetical protein
MSKRAQDLARLAADERTPEGERVAAALALAKLVVKEGATHHEPTSQAEALLRIQVAFLRDELRNLLADAAIANTVEARRHTKALEDIVKQNAVELDGLRADKAALEAELKAARARAMPLYMSIPKGGF